MIFHISSWPLLTSTGIFKLYCAPWKQQIEKALCMWESTTYYTADPRNQLQLRRQAMRVGCLKLQNWILLENKLSTTIIRQSLEYTQSVAVYWYTGKLIFFWSIFRWQICARWASGLDFCRSFTARALASVPCQSWRAFTPNHLCFFLKCHLVFLLLFWERPHTQIEPACQPRI